MIQLITEPARKGEKPMINKVGQIMLYVNNQDESLKFWTENIRI